MRERRALPPEVVARLARLDAALPPYRRERLRPPGEAQALRELGTPEELIGPVGTDEEVAAQRAELVEFARRLRASAAARR
jgi:hypothetical protein